MARLPSWRESQTSSYSGARRQGSGINRIHGVRNDHGRGLADGPYDGPDVFIDSNWGYDTGTYDQSDDMSYMSAHPSWQDPGVRASTVNRPPWGYGSYPTPQGTGYRAFKTGLSPREGAANQLPVGQAGEGWENKPAKGMVLDSDDPDTGQLYVQTSMRQRDVSKDNSRAQARGTDDPRTEIPSRIPGMRTKVYSGGQRHEDMYPYQATYAPRPFIYRMAGTGRPADMDANAMYVSDPITREPPPDTYLGPGETTMAGDAGLVSENFYYG